VEWVTGSGHVEEFQRRAGSFESPRRELRESHVHDVIITKEAPNYRMNEGAGIAAR